ncbi:GNAT family N-acetyltransferase [Eubacteriales bacterium OttesenSCG-928-N13]|nr:GNAT family N-acetyltransferase [Eubacteriales bacterium OttesenSCG-928-N13]
MAADLLVKLYEIQENYALLDRLNKQGITIRRALPADMHRLREFAILHFSEGWADECIVSVAHSGCFIAVLDKQIVGFACTEAMPDYFGPTGVLETMRGKGIGNALLLRCLVSMRERGYAYAIIGYVDEAMEFYKKTIGAIEIPDSIPGHFGNLISFD